MAVKSTAAATFLAYVTDLHRAVHAVGHLLDVRLEGAVTQPEALVLITLSGRTSATINSLHRSLIVRRSTLTSALDRLEGKGYVVRALAKADRRSVSVRLTPPGRRFTQSILETIDDLRSGVDDTCAILDRDVLAARSVASTALSKAGAAFGATSARGE